MVIMKSAIAVYLTLAVCSYFVIANDSPRWCAQSVEAFRKCQMISKAYPNQIKCIIGSGEEDCYRKIAAGLADLSAFDGGSIYNAGKSHSLKVIMSERLKSLAESGTKYFAVAVVKASSRLTYDTLKGARSCHTGVQKSSGWILPIGNLLSSNAMSCVNGDQYESVAAYFSASCAPGAASPKYNRNAESAVKLCSLCSGVGNAKCARDSNEPYYGYGGAFQCLKDGAGDVAFIKQSILTSLSPADQAEFKILCPDNSRADPKDYLTCNLAGAPAHAILTRSDASKAEIQEYQDLLERAAGKFDPVLNPRMNIFDGKLLSKSAIGLDRVPDDKRSYIAYLGEEYVKAIAAFEGCK